MALLSAHLSCSLPTAEQLMQTERLCRQLSSRTVGRFIMRRPLESRRHDALLARSKGHHHGHRSLALHAPHVVPVPVPMPGPARQIGNEARVRRTRASAEQLPELSPRLPNSC